LSRRARGRPARRLSHSGGHHDLRIAVCHAPVAEALAGPRPLRSRPLHGAERRAAAALRVHSVRGRPSELHRLEHRDRRAQARSGYDRAALRAHAGSRPACRSLRGNHDVFPLWHEHARESNLGAMSEPKQQASLKHRDYYDRAADLIPQFSVLNYGFTSEPENSVIAADDPEFYCLRLYEHTVRDTPLLGSDVLEISCGRGGGASFVTRAFRPQRYLGVDLSEENIRLARSRAARDGLTFEIGNAEQLDIADAAFDVVINIEA